MAPQGRQPPFENLKHEVFKEFWGVLRYPRFNRKRDEKALKISDRNRKSNLLCKFGTSVGSFSAPLVPLVPPAARAIETSGAPVGNQTTGRAAREPEVFKQTKFKIFDFKGFQWSVALTLEAFPNFNLKLLYVIQRQIQLLLKLRITSLIKNQGCQFDVGQVIKDKGK